MRIGNQEVDIDSLIIGEVTTANLTEVISLLEMVWWDHFPGIISTEQIHYMLSRGYSEGSVSKELECGTVSWVTLLNCDELVGVASYGPGDNRDEMQLYKLYIHPQFQRAGYGSALIRYLQEEAAENGYKYIVLTVNRNNHTAIASYQKNGFVIRESRLTDIGNGFVMDDYMMRKSIL